MFNPNDPLVKENLPKIKKKLKEDANLKVYFVASEELKKLLITGTHPLLQGIPKNYVEVLISGKGLIMAKGLLYKWLAGETDEKHTFLLSKGEFRIVGTTIPVKNILEKGD